MATILGPTRRQVNAEDYSGKFMRRRREWRRGGNGPLAPKSELKPKLDLPGGSDSFDDSAYVGGQDAAARWIGAGVARRILTARFPPKRPH